MLSSSCSSVKAYCKFPAIIIFSPFFRPAQSGLHLRHALVLLGATSFQPVRSRPGKINEWTGGSISVKTHNCQMYHLVMTNIAMVRWAHL